MKLTRFAACGCAAAILTALVAAAPARATRYVALGDSYSSGTGARAYYDRGCKRSTASYPFLLHRAHPDWAFVQVACSGAKTADLLRVQAFSLTPGTDWVTYTVGGNDAGFSKVIKRCVPPGWASDCDAAIEAAQNYIATALPRRLDRVNGRIRSLAPTAEVVVLDYPHLFAGEDCGTATFFSPDEESRLNETGDMLRSTRGRAARAGSGFIFRDVIPAFAGHALCDPAPWLHGLTIPVGESFHPTRAGQGSGYYPVVRAVTG